ncbi:Terminal uridylyltransferase [Drechslerella dactyloides]|uniref:polynucleotide adenylyltransferase n=1 Tax=Drechslerella dactyloides TaxID=74499 RepID=A0AAD6NLS4_DREDA|nr:Terminal uridylyltransferase [Drechslerella dactyloides]
MDRRNAPSLLRAGDIGRPSNASHLTGPNQDASPQIPQNPRSMDPAGSQNLESQLRGMLLQGHPSALDAISQQAQPSSGHEQRQPSVPAQSMGPVPPFAGQFHQFPTPATPHGLLPSPNIHQQQQHPQRMLQRSSTLPAQGGSPHPPPGLDRGSTFHAPAPAPPFGFHGQWSRGGHRGRYGNRQNTFQQHAPVPQMNNALHFPPLGTMPAQAPPPLAERSPPQMNKINDPRRHSGPSHFNDKRHSPTYNRNEAFQAPTGPSQGFGGSPPQNRRGRPYHNYRGSHGGGGSRGHRNFWPLDYDVMTDYAKSIVEGVSPTAEEIGMKDKMLRRISTICDELVPGSRIIPFGSLVSGFATKGADMDVIFAHDTVDPQPSSLESNIPVRLASEFLKRGFEVDLLIKTRVPILKLKTPTKETPSRPGSPLTEHSLQGEAVVEEEPWPENVSCDIGFKAHLGITNSHFFRTYSHCDPRFREMVLFIKVSLISSSSSSSSANGRQQWSKNRDLNSPYFGTLSSYGYVLMVAHFLINIVQPPVLPNLQLIPPPADTPVSELTQDGYNIWYFKDLSKIKSGDLLPNGKNEMSLGQLIHEFFQYYTTNFNFVSECVTIRTPGGVMYKQQKGWTSARERVGEMNNTYQDRYLLALEDPFEISHNVGRTCGGGGVRRIRGEMHRAAAIIRKISTPLLNEPAPVGSGRNAAGWEMPLAVEDLMVTVRQHNRGFRNRKNNQKNLVEWIRQDWTVGECLAQIDAAAEELKKKRELGLPDDAELPPESEEGSEGTDGEDGEETDSSSSDDSALRVVVRSDGGAAENLQGLRI